MKDITYIPFEEIDIVKWNSCIHYAVNGNIFAYHWYLTNAVREWDALVFDDYETVLPLLSRRLFPAYQELHQPPLMGKLGVFSVNMLSKDKVNRMLEAIPGKFQTVEMQLNDLNRLDHRSPLHHRKETDYSLYLKPEYEQIAANYSPAIRTLLDEPNNDWYFNNSVPPERFIEYMTEHSTQSFDKHSAHRLLYNGLHRGIAMMFVLRDASGTFVAGALLISSHGRLYHILSGSNARFDSDRARSFLWDRIIRTYSNRPLILDFNLPGASFPAQFGAKPYDFYTLFKPHPLTTWAHQLVSWFRKKDSSRP